MWQKCPVCDGSGYLSYSYHETTCSTCKGARIISEINGMPPAGQIPEIVTTTGDMVINTGEYRGSLTDEEKQFLFDSKISQALKKGPTKKKLNN